MDTKQEFYKPLIYYIYEKDIYWDYGCFCSRFLYKN